MATIHNLIASDVWPNGFLLRCADCGYTAAHDNAAGARFLRDGWPKHCNKTMPLEGLLTRREAAQKLGVTYTRIGQLAKQYGWSKWRHGQLNLLSERDVDSLPSTEERLQAYHARLRARGAARKAEREERRRARQAAKQVCPHCHAGSQPQMRYKRLMHCVDTEQGLWEMCRKSPPAAADGAGAGDGEGA